MFYSNYSFIGDYLNEKFSSNLFIKTNLYNTKKIMPIQENILNQMICCLNTDGHIVCEPILLKCGANACKQCVVESTNSSMKCFNCNENHEKNDVSNAPINKMVEYVIQLNLNGN